MPEVDITVTQSAHTWILRCPSWIEGQKPLEAPFNKKKVRQAIAMAIDKEKLLNLSWGGFGTIEVGPVPSLFKQHALDEADQFPYDPVLAEKLLHEAGYPNGFSTELTTWNLPYMTKPAQLIQYMLKKVGITVHLNILEMAQYFDRAYRYDLEMSLHVSTAGFDPEEYLVPYFGPLEQSTYYKWSNKEIWRMIKKQSGILDEKQRAAYIKEIQRKLLDDAPILFLYSQDRFTATKPYVHPKYYAHDTQLLVCETYWIEKH